jgi:4-hydroxybenzoate polyprenyltransferase
MNLPYDPLVLLIVLLLTLLMYNRDRLADYSQKDDRVNMQERAYWISTHLRQLRILVISSTIILCVLLVLRPVALLPIGCGLGFSLSYSAKILPGGRAPKQLPFLKVPYVAALWTVLAVGIPLTVAGGSWNWRVLLVANAIFYLAAALVNLNDIRDVEGDRLVGTQTIAVLWGKPMAGLVSIILSGIAASVAIPLRSVGLFLVAIYTIILVITYRTHADRIYRPFIEGAGIVAGLVVLLAG